MQHKIKYLIITTLLFLLIFINKKHNHLPMNFAENEKIHNISCKLDSSFIFRNQGELFYDKNNNFRFILNLNKDKQIDIGSNNKFYWFFYKPFSKKLHYWERNSYSDVIYEFHPDFLKQIMDLNFNPRINFLIINQEIIKKIVEEKNKKIFYFFYNEKNECVISFEIIEFQNIENYLVPKKINIKSKKLGNLSIEIKDVKINNKINNLVWEMPKINSINISKN
jgi:hypothetical protein